MENFGKSLLLNSLYGTALTLLVVSGAAYAADDEAIEEIVVTGSYLKRTAADSPSPLSIITSADIEDLGAQDVGEIVQALPWQSGSVSRTANYGGQSAWGYLSINLRNLGHGSTLPLVNGKRNVASWYNEQGSSSVNVNALVPNIALDRIEIVKDGASALYGSDAIAGVVNFITKKDFEGFDATYEFTTDDETGLGDTNNLQIIFGVQGDNGGMVLAAGVLDRDGITYDDRRERFLGTTASSYGQPGRFSPTDSTAVVWADHGLQPGMAIGRLPRSPQAAMDIDFGGADVNCEDAAALEPGGPLGVRVTGGQSNQCLFDYGSFFPLQADETLSKFHVTGHYELTSDFELYVEFGASDSEYYRGNSLSPSVPALPIPVDNPGLIEDAWRRGIVPTELTGFTRMLGGTINTPADRQPLRTETFFNRVDQRMLIGGIWDMAFGDRDWTLDVSYTASEHDVARTGIQDTLSVQYELALRGLGGPRCSLADVDKGTQTAGDGNVAYAASNGDFGAGNCYYFNPFGNNRFDRDGNLGQEDLTLVNPVELYSWLAGRITQDNQYRQQVVDATFAGDLFEAGNISGGLAVGFQRRRDTARALYDAATNTNNLDFFYGAQDWEGNITTLAYFVEFGLQFGDILDINATVRYEDFDEIGENTTDPKLTILLRPADSLSLRVSYGSSFRVASLQQLFGSLTTLENFSGTIGIDPGSYRPVISDGNMNLKPEEANALNFGISWIPTGGALEGLQIDLDYYNYDYTDIITRESANSILDADGNALLAAAGADDRPALIAAINAGAGNRRQVIRNPQGAVLRVLPNFLNASSADVSGVDLDASYSFDTAAGLFRIGLQAALIREYKIKLTPGNELDALGKFNEGNAVARSLPEYKINGSLSWNMGSHRALLAVRYVDAFEFGKSASGFRTTAVRIAQGDAAAERFRDTDIDSFTTFDVQYTFTFGEAGWLSSSSVTVGAKNITNEEPPWVPGLSGYDPLSHDARGRIWFLRLGGSL